MKALPNWDARASEGTGQSYITSHIIMNSCGSCLLIRRKSELKPSKYLAAFLERIVATSGGLDQYLWFTQRECFFRLCFGRTIMRDRCLALCRRGIILGFER